MILYYSDWANLHPSAIADTHTSNDSFLRMASIYKTMGIKNHAFMLALHNPDLQGIDPHREDLTIQEQALIALECQENPWYFFREVARIPGIGSPVPVKLKANRGNMALYWLFFNNVTTLLVQIRQTGKTTSVVVLKRYLLNLGCVNTEINLLTKDETSRADDLSRMKDQGMLLPDYLQMRTRADVSNTEEITIRSLGNRYKSHLSNSSPKLALKVGRGLTSPIFHVDEAAFVSNVEVALPAALASGTAAREIARLSNAYFGTVMTTTAGKIDDRDGGYMYGVRNSSAKWTEYMLDTVDQKELHKVIKKHSGRGEIRVSCEFDHQQLGYTDAWLRQALLETMSTGEAADRDYFNRWTSGSQTNPIPTYLLERIRDSEVKDPYHEISSPYGYISRWYVPESQIASYTANQYLIMSLDPSDASGDDDIGMHIRSIRSGETVVAGKYNETNLLEFSEWVFKNWILRFPNLLLIVERRSSGAYILDYLILMCVSHGIDPFKRLFNRVVNDRDLYPDRFKEIQRPMYSRPDDVYIRYKKMFGFATSGMGLTSRSELYGTTLMNAVKYTGDKIKDKELIDQLLGLVKRNGRVDHAVGQHDDLCIASLLSYWVMSQAKYLDYYGIISRDIMIENKVMMSSENTIEIANKIEQEHLRARIETLVEAIKNERDELLSYKKETELRSIAAQLTEDNRKLFAYDDLIQELRKKKSFAHNRYARSSYF